MSPNKLTPSLKPGHWITGLFIFSALLFFWAAGGPFSSSGSAALAAPLSQAPIYTPTPMPDGRIIYIVKENDTLLSISLLTNVDVETLRSLNELTNDVIMPGQELLLGMAGPLETTPTAGPSPTPTPVLPTATPKPGSGNLCILLFLDANGDAIRQEGEDTIPGGAVSVTNRTGSVSLTTTTEAGTEPFCFEKVPEGDYNVSVAVPSGYNPTTVTSVALSLLPGNQTYLDFGAQENSATISEAPTPSGSGRSPVLGMVGGVLLLLGLGLAVFAGKVMKR